MDGFGLSTKGGRKRESRHLKDFDEVDLPHHKTIFALATGIWVLNVGLLIAGGVLAGVIDYRWKDDSTRSWSHDNDSSVQSRARLAFFYITVPFAFSVVSSVELSRLNRKELPSRWIPISSACAFVLWAVQVGWQARCIWFRMEDRGTCPFAFAGRAVPQNTWGTGLVAAWVVPWFILPLLVIYIAYFIFGLKAQMSFKMKRAATIPLIEREINEVHDPGYDGLSRSSPPEHHETASQLNIR